MNVGQLRAALANLPDDLPVVIEQEDIELVGTYVELMSIRRTDTEIRYAPEDFSLDGSRPYDRPDWWSTSRKREAKTEPVVIVGCRVERPPTIDGELAQPELGSGDQQ